MTRKIKLLYVIGTLELGGAEGQLVRLATHLDRQRYEVVVCCLSAGGLHQHALEAAGIRVDIVKFRGFRQAPHRVLMRFLELVAVMRRARPDIVHGFLFWAYVLGAYAARVAGVPAVVSSRRSLSCFKAGIRLSGPLEWWANRMTDLVIANSEAVRLDAIQQEGLPPGKVTVVHNGLQPDLFQEPAGPELRRSLGLPADGPSVGVVANLIHYKGHRFFLEAWARVLDRFPKAVALLVGEGPMRQDIEARVRALELGNSVRLLGSRPDVPSLLSLMDLLVHPSLEEGFCNAILEAMAAGRPVVATAVGGNPESVVDGVTGLLVPPGDAPSLADAMLLLLEDPARAAAFGEAGRRRALEHFELSSMVRRYESIYERLARDKGILRFDLDAPDGARG